MNFKSKYSIALGSLLFLGAAAFTSCCDDNDWDVDSNFDRMFHPTSLTVDPLDDKVAVVFGKIPGAKGYQVEVSRDSLYDEIELNANGNSLIVELTSSPDTIYNLEGSTKYFLRMRTLGENDKVSKWKYLTKYSFKTKSEQIITNIIPSSHSAVVYYNAEKTIDAAYVYKDEDSTRVDDSAIDFENGVVNVTGLKDNSTYRIKLWNGDNVRGNMSFKTTEDFPEGHDIINLAEGDDLNAILENSANDKLVILMPQGLDYYMPVGEDGNYKTPKIPANIKSIYFWGAAGEGKPTFHIRGAGIDGDKDIVRFYNINLVNNGPSDNYVLNISGGNNIGKLQVEKCTIMNTRGVIRFQNITGGHVGEITVNNCEISNIGSYGFFNSKDQKNMTIGSLNLSNTTISGVAAGALINVAQEGINVNIDHCTIYNCVQAGKSLIDVNKLGITPNVSNTLIGPFNGSDGAKTIKGCSMKGQQTVENTFYTSDQLWNSGYELGNELPASSKDFCIDAANGNFKVNIAYRDMYGKYGDQRWSDDE